MKNYLNFSSPLLGVFMLLSTGFGGCKKSRPQSNTKHNVPPTMKESFSQGNILADKGPLTLHHTHHTTRDIISKEALPYPSTGNDNLIVPHVVPRSDPPNTTTAVESIQEGHTTDRCTNENMPLTRVTPATTYLPHVANTVNHFITYSKDIPSQIYQYLTNFSKHSSNHDGKGEKLYTPLNQTNKNSSFESEETTFLTDDEDNKIDSLDFLTDDED